jgi:hypothetical protein
MKRLFAALAFGLIVYGCHTYGGDHIRGVVWSRAIHKCARLATTMNVASRFCVTGVSSNGSSTSGAVHRASVENKLFMGKLDQRTEDNQKVDARDPALKNGYRRTRLTNMITMAR